MAIKKHLIFGDSHLESLKEPDNSYILFKEVVKRVRPHKIISLGDSLDFSYISRFSSVGESEGCRIKDDIELFKNEFNYFKKYAKEEVIFLSGNHEDRLKKLFNSQPVLKGIVDLETVCKELEVTYIPTEKQPYKLFKDLYIVHGLCFNKNYTAKLADTMGASIITAHTHRTQLTVNSYPDGRIIQSWGIGSLCDTIEYYEKGKRLTGHSNSFMELLVDEDTEFWQCNLIIINNNKCYVDNKLYSLETPSD